MILENKQQKLVDTKEINHNKNILNESTKRKKKCFFSCLRNYKKRNGQFGQIKNKLINKKKIISHQSQKIGYFV
jgi:hypothetical protein